MAFEKHPAPLTPGQRIRLAIIAGTASAVTLAAVFGSLKGHDTDKMTPTDTVDPIVRKDTRQLQPLLDARYPVVDELVAYRAPGDTAGHFNFDAKSYADRKGDDISCGGDYIVLAGQVALSGEVTCGDPKPTE